ncbi:hypothetical protein HaloA020_29290 [Halomonas sp. A020]|nr:hypothetical protein HaloA020_29290 [Halomonas sp. A020]
MLNACTFKSREAAKLHYLSLIDSLAADKRYVDPALLDLHRQKLLEANQGGGEYLEAEAIEVGMPLDVLVSSVLHQHQRRQKWTQQIELARIKTKSLVRKAASASEMHMLVNRFKQQLTMI